MTEPETLEALDIFVGEWRLSTSFAPNAAEAPRASTTFEWLSGRRFLVERWEIEHPDAPDGIAIIGYGNEHHTLLQHYFDSRGVSRVYEMTFSDRVWTLQRFAAAPDFSQRFTGTFSEDANTIAGSWESSPTARTGRTTSTSRIRECARSKGAQAPCRRIAACRDEPG